MRRRLIAFAAAVVVLAACSGDARLPSAVEAPTTTTAEAPSTTELPPDTSKCNDSNPGTASYNATNSYSATNPLPAVGAMPERSTMANIVKRGTLRVGVSADTLLFGFRNPLTGEIAGFDIDMLTYVAQALFGGDIEQARGHLEFKVIPYSQRLPSLQDGSVDLVAHTMTINCARWQQIAFSSEYFSAGQQVLVKNDGSGIDNIDDLVAQSKTICVPEGSTSQDEMVKRESSGLKVIARGDITDCLVAMQQGDADAAAGDNTVLAGFAEQDPTTKMSTGAPFTYEPYGIGVNAGQVDLVEFVNGVLQQIRDDGRWTESYETWLVPTLSAQAPAPPVAHDGRTP